MPNLSGKVAIITGSSSGIGQACAVDFAKLGAFVSVTGRNETNLNKTKQQCIEAGLKEDQVLTTVADVNKEEDLKRLVDGTLEKFKKIDILVNSAGLVEMDCSINAPIEAFDRLIHTNIRSVIILTKMCLDQLKQNKGAVVNVGSVQSFLPDAPSMYLIISKAAVDYFGKCLALEVASSGVRVNTVCPAFIDTPITGTMGVDRQKLIDMFGPTHPLGRVGQPEEVAKAVSFLASDDASFITGHMLPIDGGIATGMVSTPDFTKLLKKPE